jgi:azurin
MTSKNKLKYLFLLGVLIAAGFALADALGFFNLKPYTEVHHGPIIHYVPDNREPDISIERFPTQKPRPEEMITPTGQIIKKSEWKQRQKENASPNTAVSDTSEGKNIRTIDIIGTNRMKFMVSEKKEGIATDGSLPGSTDNQYLLLKSITAKPGERIRIRLTTLSQLQPEMMSHNWVLLDQGVDTQAFVNAANRENDFLRSDREEDIIGYTKLAGDGEPVEVTFTAPEEPGRYEFLCSFMAHFAAGMRGGLIVQL